MVLDERDMKVDWISEAPDIREATVKEILDEQERDFFV